MFLQLFSCDVCSIGGGSALHLGLCFFVEIGARARLHVYINVYIVAVAAAAATSCMVCIELLSLMTWFRYGL